MPDLIRLTNKFNKITNQPKHFGTSDLLYPAEIHTIDVIGKKQAETVTELCKLFGVTKGAVSQIIGKLHRKGYVNKIRNKDFGKEKILSLTHKGYRAFEAHINFHKIIDKDILRNSKDISIQEFEQFRKMLKKIEAHIDEFIKKYK